MDISILFIPLYVLQLCHVVSFQVSNFRGGGGIGCVYTTTTSFPGCRDYAGIITELSRKNGVCHSHQVPVQYRGKSHNLRSNVVWILRLLIRSLSLNLRVLTPNHMVNYFQPDSTDARSSTLKKISATTCSPRAHVLAHMLKSFVDTHTLAAKSINIVRI